MPKKTTKSNTKSEIDMAHKKAQTEVLKKVADGSIFEGIQKAINPPRGGGGREPSPSALDWAGHFMHIASLAKQLGDEEFFEQMKKTALAHVKKAATEKPSGYRGGAYLGGSDFLSAV